MQPKFCQFQQEPQRKRLSTAGLENKIKISYQEENTERIEVESMVQFEARIENSQNEEEGKAK